MLVHLNEFLPPFQCKKASLMSPCHSCFGQMLRLYMGYSKKMFFHGDCSTEHFFLSLYSTGNFNLVEFHLLFYSYLYFYSSFIIHCNSVRITSNEAIVLESCHQCLLSSYFHFQRLVLY